MYALISTKAEESPRNSSNTPEHAALLQLSAKAISNDKTFRCAPQCNATKMAHSVNIDTGPVVMARSIRLRRNAERHIVVLGTDSFVIPRAAVSTGRAMCRVAFLWSKVFWSVVNFT